MGLGSEPGGPHRLELLRFTTNVTKRKAGEALLLLRSGEYWQFASRLCANCLPSKLVQLNKSHLMALRLQGPIVAACQTETVVRRAGLMDLPGIMECSQDDSGMASTELFERFFASGHICYLIEQGEKILGYCWVFSERYCITYDGYKRSNIGLCLDPHSVFVGNVFINPTYRRQGLYTRMLDAVVSDQRTSREISEVLVAVKASNAVSLAAHRNQGFRMTCTLYCLAVHLLTCVVAAPRVGRIRIYLGNNGKAIEYARLCRHPSPSVPNP
jgi:ribosomal protein S18 acetylase RimI-like enzyme